MPSLLSTAAQLMEAMSAISTPTASPLTTAFMSPSLPTLQTTCRTSMLPVGGKVGPLVGVGERRANEIYRL